MESPSTNLINVMEKKKHNLTVIIPSLISLTPTKNKTNELTKIKIPKKMPSIFNGNEINTFVNIDNLYSNCNEILTNTDSCFLDTSYPIAQSLYPNTYVCNNITVARIKHYFECDCTLKNSDMCHSIRRGVSSMLLHEKNYCICDEINIKFCKCTTNKIIDEHSENIKSYLLSITKNSNKIISVSLIGISALSSLEQKNPDKFICYHTKIHDSPKEIEKMNIFFDSVKDKLCKHIDNGDCVIINCLAGRSRSVAFYIALIMYYSAMRKLQILTPKEYIDAIHAQKVNPITPFDGQTYSITFGITSFELWLLEIYDKLK